MSAELRGTSCYVAWRAARRGPLFFLSARAQPWVVLLTGVAVFAATPVAIVLLFVTGIGWLLALVLMAAYGLALLLGGLSGLIVVARLGLARVTSDSAPSLGKTWPAIAVAALVLSLLYVVPPIGILAGTLSPFLGLGVEARRPIRGCGRNSGNRFLALNTIRALAADYTSNSDDYGVDFTLHGPAVAAILSF